MSVICETVTMRTWLLSMRVLVIICDTVCRSNTLWESRGPQMLSVRLHLLVKVWLLSVKVWVCVCCLGDCLCARVHPLRVCI